MGPIEAVLPDAGGVLVLPDRALITAGLGPGPWQEAPEALDQAHYRAVAAVDEARPSSERAIYPVYVAAYLQALGVAPAPGDVVDRLRSIFDSGAPAWTTVVPQSVAALRTIAAAGLRVVIVSNSAAARLEEASEFLAGLRVVHRLRLWRHPLAFCVVSIRRTRALSLAALA